ncbi:MAG: hypothetical protein M9960_06355 [Xanthomonadaceae bacterium]|nr:hypothetical protein [Xanthomonadaceae bacterium]
MLVLITLLALAASSSSVLQEKMVGGMRNQQLSAMGADSALRGAEAWVWGLTFSSSAGQPLPPCIGSSTGTCVHRPTNDGTLKSGVQAFRSSHAWVNPPGGAPGYVHTLTGLTGNLATASLARQPALMIEDMGPNVPPGAGRQTGAIDSEGRTSAGKSNFYRITARSQGGSAAATRVLESVFSSADLTNTGTQD